MTTSTAAHIATLKSLTFGVEIETVGLSRERVAEKVADALVATYGGQVRITTARGFSSSTTYQVTTEDGRVWSVMRDGSLLDGGAEIVTPVLRYTDLEALQAVVRAVRKGGARSKHEDNCGIHVHVGLVDAEPAVVGRLAKLVSKVDGLVRQSLQVAPRRADYCKPLPEAFVAAVKPTMTKAQLATAWGGAVYGADIEAGRAPSRYDSTRYRGLNLNSWFYRGTVEFRYFNGTLHAGEVKAYVQFCLGMVAKAVTSSSIASERRGAEVAASPYVSMNTFLARRRGLNLTGPEFATMRLHMTKLLTGAPARVVARGSEAA